MTVHKTVPFHFLFFYFELFSWSVLPLWPKREQVKSWEIFVINGRSTILDFREMFKLRSYHLCVHNARRELSVVLKNPPNNLGMRTQSGKYF